MNPPAHWRRLLAAERRPDARVATLQVAATLGAFALAFPAPFLVARASYALALLLCVPAAALMVRLFILQHDCMHGSLFPSPRANVAVGYLLSLITLTPHHRWRATHLLHHARAGNLDQRAPDLDIYTMTAAEYRAAPPRRRLLYRLFRHRAVLIGLLPVLVFLVEHRFARGGPVRPRERRSVRFTNAGFALLLLLGHLTVGLPRFLSLYLPIAALASSAGVWLFYVQHHFAGSLWRPGARWSFLEAGLRSASFYDLPAPLAWWTAYIGYHHVHHLDPGIPNYRLRACHRAHPFLQGATRLTLLQTLRAPPADCWDEERGRMVALCEISRAQGG